MTRVLLICLLAVTGFVGEVTYLGFLDVGAMTTQHGVMG
jgi:hypothetical protein